MDDERMCLTILGHDVYIVVFKLSALPEFMHVIVEALFYQKHEFFNFTMTSDKGGEGYVSMIVNGDILKRLPAERLSVTTSPWRPMQISEGSLGQSEVGIVTKLSKPLALADISIFNVSTFETEYAMVHSCDLDAAADALEEHFIIEENESVCCDIDLGLYSCKEWATPQPGEGPSKRRYVSKPDAYVRFGALRSLEEVQGELTKLIFYDRPDFLVITVTKHEVSLTMTAEQFDALPDHKIAREWKSKWQAIMIDDAPLGFDESGVVLRLAEPLSSLPISIMYLSTYLTDFVFHREEATDAARKAVSVELI